MEKEPLANRLEYAILKAIASTQDGKLNTSMPNWKVTWIEKEGRIPQKDFSPADLLAAFKRLWREGIINLAQWRGTEKSEYSGNEADDRQFFGHDDFRASLTDGGRSYWDNLQHKHGGSIGFGA